MSRVDMTVLAKKEYPSVLRNKHFRRLCAAQFISLVATYAIYFASMALVEEITHSSAQMGLMIFSSTLPGLLFGLLAGVVVDRYERVKVMMGANIMRALVALAFTAAVYFFPHIYLLLTIYLTNFCLSALAQFVISAEGATIPYLVGEKRLMAANSFFNVSSLASQGVGLILLAPLLLKISGAGAVGLVGATFYLMAFAAAIRLPRENMLRKPRRGRKPAEVWAEFWAEFKEGWRFISSDPLVAWATFQLTLTSMLTLMLSTLAPGFVVRVLGMEVADAVYMAVPAGIGFGLGIALVGKRGELLSKEKWISFGFVALGLGLVVLPFLRSVSGPSLFLLAMVIFAIGLGLALITIPAKTILQERPPAGMRGRVISTQLVLGNAASTLPMPLGGGLADLIGIRKTIFILACITLGAAAASIRQIRG